MSLLPIIVGFACLTVPGFVFYRLLGFRDNVFLASVAISVSLLVISQVPVRVARLPVDGWLMVLAVVTACGLFAHLVLSVKRSGFRFRPILRYRSCAYVGAFAVIAIWSLYHLVVGGYSEVPSDFWNHMERIRWEVERQSNGDLLYYDFSFTGLVNRDYTHALHALVSTQLGIHRLDLVENTGYLATLMFLLCSYWFVFPLFDEQRYPDQTRTWIAISAVLIVLVWKGITVFSFVRYYAMAPAMLGFPVYYAFVVLWMDLLRGNGMPLRTVFVLIMLAVAMLLLHQQELGFAVVMAITILVTYVVLDPGARQGRKGLALLVALITTAATVVVVSVLLVLRREPGPVIGTKLTFVGDYFPFLEDAFVLNPQYQFMQVVGWFGLIGLAVAFYRFRLIRNSPILVAGLILPLVTVFNPLFVYLYLHVAKFETVWRFLFIVPLPVILGAILVDFLSRLKTFPVRTKIVALVVILAMTVSLIPVDFLGYRNTYSRFGSLTDTRAQGVGWIRDVIDALSDTSTSNIFSDPVTSYVLRGATDHRVAGWKFYRGRSGHDFVNLHEEGELETFFDGQPGIYVINRRETPNTRNGADSGHWSPGILTTSRWYPQEMEEILLQRGARRIYEADGVSVLRLRADQDG